MAADRDNETRSMHWSVMEWEQEKVSKLSLSYKWDQGGECQLISTNWPYGQLGPWIRALIGGPNPNMVGGGPLHSAINRMWGPGRSSHDVRLSRLAPHLQS